MLKKALLPYPYRTIYICRMKILNAEQIRAWDRYTIESEPIASVELMERAAVRCVDWLEKNHYSGKKFFIFCGKGNNGGDGLAIARLLMEKNRFVKVFIAENTNKGTEDFQINLGRVQKIPGAEIYFIKSEQEFPRMPADAIIIDALFGSGLTRPLEGMIQQLAAYINETGCEIIAIDIPSGLFVDKSSRGHTIVKARHTLTFQSFKPAFLVAENAPCTGTVHILDIGLKKEFPDQTDAKWELVDEEIIHSIYRPREPFAHKGTYGHALLVAGSYGKMGAAILAARACLRSGVGLLTCHIPKSGYGIMQRSVPEAMVVTDINASCITQIEKDVTKYNTSGIGPGIGTAAKTRDALRNFFSVYQKPVVIDADGLNCMAMEKDLLKRIPPGSILTPHPKEFERLFGQNDNDFARIEKALQQAKNLNCVIVLKGHHTLTATPEGKAFFNSTGNAGMAKGGSGDVLTGILTALLAQGYSPAHAAVLGVYLHGLAGDIAAQKMSQEAMTAGDIIEHLGEAFKGIKTNS
jgi:hydroxyethylthiazole kinase-like uncharacterized protein yjeF